MGLKPDWWIKQARIIEPFVDHQVRNGNISYGLSSYGYDIRVDDKFKVLAPPSELERYCDHPTIDPKHFDATLFTDVQTPVCIIPANSYILAQSVETFYMPPNVTGICVGKSTYVRSGIHILMSPLEACFSDDTEILTKDGWKLFKNVSVGDYVFGMSNKGIAEWQPVEKKQEYLYSGEMCLFSGRSINLLVTPDHKCLVRKSRNSRDRTVWYTETAGNIYKHHSYEMTREVVWEGEDIEDTIEVGKHVFNTNTFLRWLGIYIGDGSSFMNKGGYLIKLAAIKERKLKEYDEILTKMNLKHSNNGRGYTFHSKGLYEIVHPLGHAHEKFVPDWIKNLPPHRLEHLLWGLMHSDGNIETGMYNTSSKKLADDVQEIAFKVGLSAIVRMRPPKNIYIRGRLVRKQHDAYIIRVVGKHLSPKVRPDIQSKQYYHGVVYDVTVPGHVIFVRRNGKALWSGNCWHGVLTLEIANLTPYPAKVYAHEGIAQILFFEGDDACDVSYADRNGKYQNQAGIELSKV